MNTKSIAYVLFQFGMSVAIFSLLFFTWIKDIQKLILQSQIDRVFTEIGRDFVIIDTSNFIREKIYATLKNTLAPQRNVLLESDEKTKTVNQSVAIESASVIGIVVFICVVVSIGLCLKYKIDWADMVFDGLSCAIILSAVLILFLYLVVKNYDLIDPNIVKKTILDVLIEYSKK
jgi:hypothetical protein